MAIDLLNLKPSVISKDLKGKYVCIYSSPKMGKTTMACQFPRNLLLGFEHGWNAISGAMAVDILKWSDFKLVLRQLAKDDVKAMYDTITIDTVAIAWDLCEKYVCSQNGVQNIGDVPWGQGYKTCEKEFEESLRMITQLGYGLVVIAHEEYRTITDKDNNEIKYVTPKIPKRCYSIVNQLVDIIGYIANEWNEDGVATRWLYTRSTPTILAGSRFKYLPGKIPFGYNELSEAIGEAISYQEEHDGALVTDGPVSARVVEKLDYDAIRKESAELWTTLINSCDTEEAQTDMANRILKKVEMVFGRRMKLSEITEDQVDLFNLVLLDMRELAANLNN